MSKKIKALFDGKQYDLVIKYGFKNEEVIDKMYVLSSMMILAKDLDAINYIKENIDSLYSAYPKKVLNAHFELLLKNKLFKEAYKALEVYENKPYVSQEVEELLRELKERIAKEEHPNQKQINGIDEVNEILSNSTNNADLARVLFSLKDYNFNAYVDSLLPILKNENIHPTLRTYALIVLVENSYNKSTLFLKGTNMMSVLPSELTPPFLSDVHNSLIEKIHSLSNNNISLENTAIQLLNYYSMDIYPEVILKEDIDKTSKALIALAKQYLSMENVEKDEEINALKNQIELIINSTPALEM